METLSCHSSQSSYPTGIKKHNLLTNGIYSSQMGTKVHIIAKYGTEVIKQTIYVLVFQIYFVSTLASYKRPPLRETPGRLLELLMYIELNALSIYAKFWLHPPYGF